jgi:hypothetical protein
MKARRAPAGDRLPATEDPRIMRPWRIHREGCDAIPMATLAGAKAIARRYVEFVRIEHETSGESWVRRGPADEWRLDRQAVPGHLA